MLFGTELEAVEEIPVVSETAEARKAEAGERTRSSLDDDAMLFGSFPPGGYSAPASDMGWEPASDTGWEPASELTRRTGTDQPTSSSRCLCSDRCT